MNATCEQLEPALSAAARGDFDALTPEQIAALEAHLDTCATCAARLAKSVPQVDPALAPSVPVPTDDRWEEVWTAIDGASERRPSPQVQAPPLRRLWRPLTAVAACILLAVTLHLAPSSNANGLELQLSSHVEVHEIETFGDVTSLVDYADDGAIIWWLEDEGAQG